MEMKRKMNRNFIKKMSFDAEAGRRHINNIYVILTKNSLFVKYYKKTVQLGAYCAEF